MVRDRNLKAPKMRWWVTDGLRGLPRVLKTRPVPVPTRTRNPPRVTPPVMITNPDSGPKIYCLAKYNQRTFAIAMERPPVHKDMLDWTSDSVFDHLSM
jgi:hypothetical protein